MASLIETTVERHLDSYLKSSEFNGWLRQRVKWTLQGFEEGYDLKDRERFTETVAARIRAKIKRPTRLLWWRVWWLPLKWDECRKIAENVVTDFLRNEGIKFGDPNFHWADGHDIADEEMSYWEARS
jgi:hypothetical protein